MRLDLPTAYSRVRRVVRERAPRGDAGTTLIELVVGMAVMAIFMGIFTVTMVSMSNTTNTVQVVSDTTNQATNAFLRLDREIRYASAISTPAFDSSSSMWHVEFTTGVVNRPNTSTVTNSNQCTQIAIAPPTTATGNVGVLKQRTWTVGDSSPGPWGAIASYVTNYSATTSIPPFPATTSISGSNASTSMQQLTVRLAFAKTSVSTNTVSTYTFTALNSAATSNATPVCQQFAVGSTG